MKLTESLKKWTFQLNHMFIILFLLNQLIYTYASTPDDQQKFEQSLKQRDYNQALLNYNSIKTNKNIIEEVIKSIYQESNNIDILLHFTSLINDINDRAAVYDSIYNLIIKDGGLSMYTNGTDTFRIRGLYSCNTMKYLEKLDNTLLKLLDKNTELYKTNKMHVENMKNDLSNKMINEIRGLTSDFKNFTRFEFKSTNENLKCRVILNDTNILVKQYEMLLNNTDTDSIDCSLIVTDGTNDLQIMKQVVIAQNKFDKLKEGFSFKYNYNVEETKEFQNALMDKDFNLALIKLNSINNDTLINLSLKKLYREFYNLNDLIYFASLVTNKNNGNLNLIKSIIETLQDIEKVGNCEMIKVIDILQQLRFKQPQHEALIQYTNEIKSNLTKTIKAYEKDLLSSRVFKEPSENGDLLLFKINNSYVIDIYDQSGDLHLGRIEYFLKRTDDNETLCYYRGTASITNYDYWYMKNYLIVVNWFAFIILVTKFC